jgi:hypothetical protein
MNYRSDFDLDLSTGQQGESLVQDMLQLSTIEVKTDFLADKTGNIAVEYESWGNPSGIAVTKARHWVFVIPNKIAIFVETNRLKDIARRFYHDGSITAGGDLNKSKMVLIPITELIHG